MRLGCAVRNLKRYPITLIEIENCLNKLADDFAAEQRMGDMRPLLLKAASKIVKRTGFVTFELDE